MTILIWLLTAILVLDCLFLMLLVLIQLPKKEAGLGQAFGASATDALFGAGSGNVLTKLTKYTTVVFFVATLVISMLQGHEARGRVSDPRNVLTEADKLSTVPKSPAAAAATPAATNAIVLSNSPTTIKLDTNRAGAAAPVTNPATQK